LRHQIIPNYWELTRYGATEFNPKAINPNGQQCLLAEIAFELQSLNFASTLSMVYEEVQFDRNLDDASESNSGSIRDLMSQPLEVLINFGCLPNLLNRQGC
jgi:hypothetical protein